MKESKLVNRREIQNFKLPLLAGSASEQRGWIHSFLAYMRRFDATADDSLWHWSSRCFEVGIKERDLADREGAHTSTPSSPPTSSTGDTIRTGGRTRTSGMFTSS